jgi:hypothetical protein
MPASLKDVNIAVHDNVAVRKYPVSDTDVVLMKLHSHVGSMTLYYRIWGGEGYIDGVFAWPGLYLCTLLH